jgi:hypothetical protein
MRAAARGASKAAPHQRKGETEEEGGVTGGFAGGSQGAFEDKLSLLKALTSGSSSALSSASLRPRTADGEEQGSKPGRRLGPGEVKVEDGVLPRELGSAEPKHKGGGGFADKLALLKSMTSVSSLLASKSDLVRLEAGAEGGRDGDSDDFFDAVVADVGAQGVAAATDVAAQERGKATARGAAANEGGVITESIFSNMWAGGARSSLSPPFLPPSLPPSLSLYTLPSSLKSQPSPSTLNSRPSTLNPQPSTLNPQLPTPNRASVETARMSYSQGKISAFDLAKFNALKPAVPQPELDASPIPRPVSFVPGVCLPPGPYGLRNSSTLTRNSKGSSEQEPPGPYPTTVRPPGPYGLRNSST